MSLRPTQQQLIDSLRGSVTSVLLPEPIYKTGFSFIEAKNRLEKTNLFSALEVMATLNAVAVAIQNPRKGTSDQKYKHIQNLYGFLFPKSRRKRAIGYTKKVMSEKFGEFNPISHWACSAMTDACLRFCDPISGTKVWPPKAEDYFGRVILSFHSQLAPDRPASEELNLENLSDDQFIDYSRNLFRANRHAYSIDDIARIYAMFEIPEVGAVLQARSHITPKSWFESHIGISPTEYRVMLLPLVAAVNDFDIDRPDVRDLIFDSEVFLRNVTPEARDVFKHLNQLAVIDLEGLRVQTKPSDWKTAMYASNSLQQRQLLEIAPSKFLVLDRDRYLDRYFRGLIHVLDDAARNSLIPNSWETLRSEAGYLFEGYVFWWLKNLFGTGANYFFNCAISEDTETDAIVFLDGTALVFEANHHWISRGEAFDASPKCLAKIVSSDIKKAVRAAKSIAANGLSADGRPLLIDRILPIVVLPEALPIAEITVLRFHQELLNEIPELDRLGPKILPAQVLTQDHLEYYDRVWNLPDQSPDLVRYLARRGSNGMTRFCPLAFDRREIKAVHGGNTMVKIHSAAKKSFMEIGPSLFTPAGGEEKGARL